MILTTFIYLFSMRKEIILKMLVILVFVISVGYHNIAFSEDILIEFPFDNGGRSGFSCTFDPRFPTAYMAKYYTYNNDEMMTDIHSSIFRDLHLTEQDIGKTFIIHSYDNYPGFATFVDNLTNGRNDWMEDMYTFAGKSSGGQQGKESGIIGLKTINEIDFEGYRINSISLHLDNLLMTLDTNTCIQTYHMDGVVTFNVTLLDENSDGIPDELEVTEYSDIDDNGVADSEQVDLRCLYTEVGQVQLCMQIPSESSSFGLIKTVDPNLIDNEIDVPDYFPIGLISFRMVVDEGATVTVPVFLSESMPEGSKWYQYDPTIGWYDCSSFATFSEDRKTVVLTLTDGGNGDIDGRRNKIIIDPSGIAIFNTDTEPETASNGGDSLCFLSTLISEK